MAEFFCKLFGTDFMPHVYCLRTPEVVWLHVISDGLIAGAYAAIPSALLRLLWKRKDLSFHRVFVLFAAFILSCGATHVLAIVTLWTPVYRLEGLVKLMTALASIATAIVLIRLMPQIAAMPSLAAGSTRQLADSMPQIVWAASPDGNVDYYNQRWCDYTGMSIEQSKNWGWGPALHPDDLRIAIDRWKHSFTTCAPFEVEVRLKRASDNVYRWHISRALPIRDAQGAVVRWFGSCTEIEDYKKAQSEIKALNERLEERVRERTVELAEANRQLAEVNRGLQQAEENGALLAAIVASSDDAIVSESLQGIVTSWNAGAERLFGYSAKEAIGQHVSLIIPSEGLERETRLLELLAQSEAVEHLETTRLHKDGQAIQVSLTLSPVRDGSGHIIGASKILRNVSERIRVLEELKTEINARKQAEEGNASLAAEAEAANRAKSTFLSTMSHEIRTPLNAILGFAQLMLRDPSLGLEAKANLQIIDRSGEHLLTLINDVLDISKIEAGRAELNPTAFDPARLLNEVAAMFRLRAETKALRFEMVVDGESVPYVLADVGKIRQVLVNLLGNAIKFTDHGQITLRVTFHEKGDKRLWLSARVEDTGSGVANEERGKLFDLFSQTKLGLTQGGTGLGLAISRRFARLMGGDIALISESGLGSVFHFEIPIERVHSGAAVRGGSPRRVIGIHTGTPAPGILVVDDQVENRDCLTKLLTAVGFSVRCADNGESAIRNWEEWKPPLILMDIHMPVMDGLEATRRIKADPRGKETAIVALTASAMEEDRRTVVQSGADDFLAKPCRENELFEMLRSFLKVTYDYEELDNVKGGAVDGMGEPTAEKLGPLPPELLEELRKTTLSGNKKLLDKLIARVRDGGDAKSASALQKLADKYDYDALMQALQKASPV